MKKRGPAAVKSLPFDQWSEVDRKAWASAYPDSPLDAIFATAPAIKQAVLEAETLRNHRFAMALYLRWLIEHSPATLNLPLKDRFERDLVTAFADDARSPDRMNGRSVAHTLCVLCAIAQRFAPTTNWRWISRLARNYQTPKPPTKRVLITRQSVYDAGIRLMDTAIKKVEALGRHAGDWDRRANAEQYRNGIIICLMAIKPLRARNMRRLALTDLIVKQSQYFIYIESRRVKNKVTVYFKIPPSFCPYFKRYLDEFRPMLPNVSEHSFVFASRFGPYSKSGFWRVVTVVMLRAFKAHLSPNDFRRLVANDVMRNRALPVSLIRNLLGQMDEDRSDINYLAVDRGLVAKKLSALTDV